MPGNLEERKLATILFADLVGSTALAHDQDPERTRLLLNRFYDAMSEEIERMTVERASSDQIKTVAVQQGMITLREDGLTKTVMGLTSIEEVARVVK